MKCTSERDFLKLYFHLNLGFFSKLSLFIVQEEHDLQYSYTGLSPSSRVYIARKFSAVFKDFQMICNMSQTHEIHYIEMFFWKGLLKIEFLSTSKPRFFSSCFFSFLKRRMIYSISKPDYYLSLGFIEPKTSVPYLKIFKWSLIWAKLMKFIILKCTSERYFLKLYFRLDLGFFL